MEQKFVNVEHFLLGLANEYDSVAKRILDRMGVSTDQLRSELERTVEQGKG